MKGLLNQTETRRISPIKSLHQTGETTSEEEISTYLKTTVVVDKVLECRGDMIVVEDADGVMAFNRNYYRIVKGGEEY